MITVILIKLLIFYLFKVNETSQNDIKIDLTVNNLHQEKVDTKENIEESSDKNLNTFNDVEGISEESNKTSEENLVKEHQKDQEDDSIMDVELVESEINIPQKVSKVAPREFQIIDYAETHTNFLQRKLDKLKSEGFGTEEFPTAKGYCRIEREKIELEKEKKLLAEGTIESNDINEKALLSTKYNLKRKFNETGSKYN